MSPSPSARALKGVWSGLAVLVLLSALPVFGSTITVTSTNDSGPGSLRDAINNASSGDTIDFSLTYPATITLSTAALTIESDGSKSLTISGPGASSLAISGGNSFQVFVIQPLLGPSGPITATISGVTIENGSSLLGGGIFNGGTLALVDSTVSNNEVGTQLGAGIFNVGTLTLNNTTITGNIIGHPITGSGAGIYNAQGTVTLINSSVSRNFGVGDGSYEGGGILNDDGLLTLTNSVVSDNDLSANAGGDARGAGIANINSGSVILTDSTVSGNFLSSIGSFTGGGISNGILPRGHGSVKLIKSTVFGNSVQGIDGGGGILNGGTTTVINSTISGNSASFGGSGGGIFNEGFGHLTVTNSTISGNSGGPSRPFGGSSGGIFNAGTATVNNSIVANNTGGNCHVTLPSTTASAGYNLSDEGTCASFFIQTGDLNNTPAGLDPVGLKNNGGPTQTIGLLPTSPAVNAIPVSSTNSCPVLTDQRGVPRPQGPACDIGAFEFFQSPFMIEAVLTFLLIDTVQMNVPPETQRGLIAPLQGAVDSLNRGDVKPAINQLGAFINHVGALVNNGTLTPPQASALTTPAQAVIQRLSNLGG